MRVVVAGGSISGLAAAIALSRASHDVVVLERDNVDAIDDWESSFERKRSVAQFLLPHAFLAGGRKALLHATPDIYGDLLRAGALEIDTCGRLPVVYRDSDLVALAARRPLVEWALLRAARSAPRVDLRPATRATGLLSEVRDGTPVVRGVVTQTGERITADLVVDAIGRTSPLSSWLCDIGGRAPLRRSTDCATLTYSRYWRLLPGAEPPEIVSPLAARGDTGYSGFALFWEDNGVFGLSQNVPAWDRELRAMARERPFMAAARAMPQLRRFLETGFAEPITGVVAMGRLRNVSREFVVDGASVALGVLAIGDALCHTNPIYAFGMSLALAQAFSLPHLLAHAEDERDLARRFHCVAGRDARERYRVAAEGDAVRIRRWRGEAVDASSPDADRPAFMASTLPAVIAADPELYVRYLRYSHVLDDPRGLENDAALLWRAAEIHRERSAARPARPMPTRDELLRAMNDA